MFEENILGDQSDLIVFLLLRIDVPIPAVKDFVAEGKLFMLVEYSFVSVLYSELIESINNSDLSSDHKNEYVTSVEGTVLGLEGRVQHKARYDGVVTK